MIACHIRIRKVAMAMTAALYEQMASDNLFYKANPSPKHFVNSWWPKLVPKARATLAQMLTGNYPQALKDEIHQVLILDHAARIGQRR